MAILVGIALTDDPTSESITADTSPFVFRRLDPAGSLLDRGDDTPTYDGGGRDDRLPGDPNPSRSRRIDTPVDRAPPPAVIPPEQRAGTAFAWSTAARRRWRQRECPRCCAVPGSRPEGPPTRRGV